MSTCRSCKAEVIFVPSAKTGKPMILDAKPEKRIVLLAPAGRDPSVLATPWPESPWPDGKVAKVIDTYVDHHATCPAAAQWKGRRRAG